MNRSSLPFAAWLLIGFLLIFLTAAVQADTPDRRMKYRVAITNITKGQIFSPPVLATHNSHISLFKLGEAAVDELAVVAEDGDGAPLVDLLNAETAVYTAMATVDPIVPGQTLTFFIESHPRYWRFSVAGMLVNTNDGFFALNKVALPRYPGSSHAYLAQAYDAGSEANNENCKFVPGPACPAGSGNQRDTAHAEGFVHIHNGIHDIADLSPDAYDWRNPVARIVITRVR